MAPIKQETKKFRELLLLVKQSGSSSATAADEWVKLGKREGKNKAVSTCGKSPATGNFAKVELLVGSGARCARANIFLWVHRYNTVVHQSVVEN